MAVRIKPTFDLDSRSFAFENVDRLIHARLADNQSRLILLILLHEPTSILKTLA